MSATLEAIPAGNVVDLYVAFLARDLTDAEERSWQATRTLPAGVGLDQPQVFVDYWINAGAAVRLATVHDAAGVYHATLLLDATMLGVFEHSGYSLDPQNAPLARNAPRAFRVVPSGPPSEIPPV